MTKLFRIPNSKTIFCCSVFTIIVGVVGLMAIHVYVSTDTSASSLEFIIVVSRHGARAPIFTYPTDPYHGTKYWPEEAGALTTTGKQQMFKIGQTLRRRYSSLFKNGYRSTDVFARSTPIVRTYMSVAVLLAGMFPPEGINVWNPSIDWQPIPIFTDYYLDKTQIVTNLSLCARFSVDETSVRNQSIINYYFKKNREFLDYVGQHSGATIADDYDYIRVWDTIVSCDIHGFPLPSWTKPIFPEKMAEAASFILKTVVVGTPVMNRLFSGPLLKDFDWWISRKLTNEVRERMVLHGGHDFTLIGLMAAVGFRDEISYYIQPAATVVIELHKSPVHLHEVRMLYYNNSDIVEPYSLNMPKCQDPCPVSSFIDVLQQMEVEGKWEAACKL